MSKRQDGFLFLYLVYPENVIILSTPLAAKKKEVLQLSGSTIQSNLNSGAVTLCQACLKSALIYRDLL